MTVQIAGLLEYIPSVWPRYTRPDHLSALTARLERARVEPLRLTVSIPPRWHKTDTLLGAMAWHLDQDPTVQTIYASYAQRIAEKKSRKGRDLCARIGIPIAEDASARSDWRTGHGDGGCWATGVEGALTGEGGDLILCDDLHKDRSSAESALQRDAVYDWFNSVLYSRGEPGASYVVCGHRWHEDDVIGRLIGQGWEHIAIPALNEAGESNYPARFPTEVLRKIREQIGEYSWWSLYMQKPRPRGGQLFGDVHYYEKLPETYAITIGCDLAYSEKTHADWSVAIVLARSGTESYVVDVVRAQETAPRFRERLTGLRAAYPGAAWRSYLAGTEKGVADVFTSLGVDLGAMRPIGDKFIRAQPVAAAWNAGRVLLPKSAPWLNAFVEELKTFTGVKDPHDDQVDALAAAFDAYSGVQQAEARAARSERYRHVRTMMAGGYSPEVEQLPEDRRDAAQLALANGRSVEDLDPMTMWQSLAAARPRDESDRALSGMSPADTAAHEEMLRRQGSPQWSGYRAQQAALAVEQDEKQKEIDELNARVLARFESKGNT